MSDKEKNLYFFYWDPQHLKQGGYADDLLWSSMGLKKNYGDRVILVNINEDSDLRSKLTRQLDLLIVEDDLAPMNKIVKAAMETRDVNEIGICFLADGLKFLVEKDISPKIMTLDFQMDGGELSKEVLEPTRKFVEELEKKSAWRSTVILGISSHANETVAHGMENIIRASGFSIYPKTDALYTLLPHILGDALSIHTLRLRSEAEGYKEGVKDTIGKTKKERPLTLPDYIIGQSRMFMNAIKISKKVAPTNATVLLLGETGVGKGVLAKFIYESSNCKNKPFVTFNCGEIANKELLTSALFGHVKGAFHGAHKDKKGYLRAADKGTLFIDEIGELDIGMQVRFLRVLQDGKFNMVGCEEGKEERVNVRFIAATNRNLEQMVSEKEFREDLYYRLNVIPIKIPPLRERREDIPLLAQYFVEKKSKDLEKNTTITREALKLLKGLDFPGNIRDLENIIERAIIIFSEDGEIDSKSIINSCKYLIKIDEGATKIKSQVKDDDTWFSDLDRDQIMQLCKKIWETEGRIIWDKKNKRNHPDMIPEVVEAEVRHDQFGYYIRTVLAIFWCFFKESEKPPEVTKQKFYDIFGFKGGGNFRGYLKNKSTTKSTSIFFPLREHVKGYGPPDLYLDGMLLKQNGIFLDIG